MATGYLQSILGTALQATGLTSKTATNSSATAGISSFGQSPDNSQLSPLGQLVTTLQQLQQSNPQQFQQVTQQIASHLQAAAQQAQAGGNSAAANQLNQLATDFSNASASGQLPSFQSLTQGISGHHHHYRSDAGSTNSASSSGSTGNSSMNELLSGFQASDQNSSVNPMSIILNTLSSAGVSISPGT
jgi:hypothetical protein